MSYPELIKKFQKYRSEKFEKIGKVLVRLKFSANLLTSLSLISGLFAVYFLFNDYYLFLIFTILHLAFDAMDGVVARLTKSSEFGKKYDLGSDTFITILAIVKAGFFLNDYYVFVVAGLFTLAAIIHFRFNLHPPIYFMRTIVLIVFIIFTIPSFPYVTEILTYSYLVAGGFSTYSLAKQLQWFLSKR